MPRRLDARFGGFPGFSKDRMSARPDRLGYMHECIIIVKTGTTRSMIHERCRKTSAGMPSSLGARPSFMRYRALSTSSTVTGSLHAGCVRSKVTHSSASCLLKSVQTGSVISPCVSQVVQLLLERTRYLFGRVESVRAEGLPELSWLTPAQFVPQVAPLGT